MLISHHPGAIFIHVHRTAGSSIISLLKELLGNRAEIISQHGNARTEEKAFINKHSDFYDFGFARNPWDRLLSWYSLLHKWDKKNLDEEKRWHERYLELEIGERILSKGYWILQLQILK